MRRVFGCLLQQIRRALVIGLLEADIRSLPQDSNLRYDVLRGPGIPDQESAELFVLAVLLVERTELRANLLVSFPKREASLQDAEHGRRVPDRLEQRRESLDDRDCLVARLEIEQLLEEDRGGWLFTSRLIETRERE